MTLNGPFLPTRRTASYGRLSKSAVLLSVVALVLSGAAPLDPVATQSSGSPRPAASAVDTGCGAGDSVAAQPAGVSAATVPAYLSVVDPQVIRAEGMAKQVAYDGAELLVGAEATDERVTIGITPLAEAEVPELDAAMTNVTQGPRRGYRFTPHPHTFQQKIQVTIPYDPALVGSEINPQDVYTYYFDDRGGCWRPLERIAVDEERHVIVSRTDHFTDMVNGVVTAPDHPEGSSFNPTQIKNIQAADPGTGISMISPPAPGNSGDARLSYPIEVPPGRAGMQPALNVAYNSSGANGWLGTGWDLRIPSVTIDTRWGVPRYDAVNETETYLLNGEQLTPVAHRGDVVARSAEKVFHTRVEGGFDKIIRHGDHPSRYSWEIVDKTGNRSFYGTAPESTLADAAGNVFQWALRETRDTNGNLVRYHTARQQDFGVPDGGTVPGTELYLERITYTGHGDTEGPYAVTFTRDRQLGEPRRADVTIDARGGFKRVSADLLRKIEVTLDGKLVRRYELTYQTGAFLKTLLKSVSQFGEDGAMFTTHEFSYFDDIRDAEGQYQAFAQAGWTSPDDNLRNGAVNAIRGGAGDASALSGNTSDGAGGHLYVGFGPTLSKRNSVGVKTGYSTSEDKGLLALTDVDGDSLPDKVFQAGDGVRYRKNLAKPGGQPRFSDDAVPLQGLPGIMAEESESLTLGVEAYPGAGAVQLDHVDTFTTTERYFSDVNGDGLTDLVDGGNVLFGRIGANGTPVYGRSSETPVPIGSGRVDSEGLINDFAADRERRNDSYPLIDTVRRWVAPYDGTVNVSGAARLAPQAKSVGNAEIDGVRVAVQHEDIELWSATIDPADTGEHAPSGVDAVPVRKGDRLYFRVGSRFDGAGDQVSWDPVLAYDSAPRTDVNGLDAYRYQASRDFTLGGRASVLTVPANGTLHLGGALIKKAATTDDVAVVITRNGQPVFEQSMPAGATGEIPVSADIPVEQGQQLEWRVRIDSPIDLDTIDWTPTAYYTAAEGVARITDEAGNFVLTTNPPYNVDMYPADRLAGPQDSFVAPAEGELIVEPALEFASGQPGGRFVFTVKRRGALLGKKIIDVVDGQVPAPADLRLTVPVAVGDEVFFDFSTVDPALAAAVTSQSVNAGYGGLAPVPSAVHTAATEGAFPQPYRGWGVIGYNGNRERAAQPITQADLVLDPSYQGQLPTDVDPQRDLAAFEADPRVTPPKVFQFSPSPETKRWGAGESSWVSRDTVSSSRLGGQSIDLPESADYRDVTAVSRISRSKQISLTGSLGGGVGSVGGSVATGDSTSELDYVDMNGDGFPDVVGNGRVQYTDASGALGTGRGTLPGGSVRESRNVTGNANAGSAARTLTTGQAEAAPPASSSANTAQTGNDMPPLGIGGNLGTGTSDTKFDLLDINGDALPDRVFEDGRVTLNLGYSFAETSEPWPGGSLNDGSSSNSGVNIGFNTDFYGFAGGASLNQGESSTSSSLLDVNGDGLADRVFDGSPIRVALNTGSGFGPQVPFHGSLSGINADSNAKLGGGVYFTFGLCFLVVLGGCVVTNPGADVSTGASRAEQMLRDINGDGYADHLKSTKDNELVVAENNTGRTNLLRSVRRPLGSTIDLDYDRDGNTYDQPQSRWVLSRVAVNDGHPGDGPDVQLSTYRYEGGTFDRLEREFFGYRAVIEEHRDAGAGEAIYRAVTREFRTDGFYTRGLLQLERTTDGAGRPFLETENTYRLQPVSPNDSAASAASTVDERSSTAAIFPQLVRTDERFYEGQAKASKSSYSEMSYDEFGNLTRTFDAGDPGESDDLETSIRYTAREPACRDNHLLGIANEVDVRGNGSLQRRRASTVDCVTGDVVKNKSFLADGTAAVTDLSYFPDGNLKSVTNPPNKSGQRYRLDYTYDDVVATHITSIKDSFGYKSKAEYNLAYGQVEVATDFNDQVMRYAYDTVGRVDSVTGPHETKDKLLTIDFEYHPEAPVPYAVTRHIDRESDGKPRPDTIDTITFTDGIGRVIQTKKDSSLYTGENTAPEAAMTISGRAVFDFLGRAVEQFYPTTEPKGTANTVFSTAIDPVQPTRIAYDVLDRTTSTVIPDNTAITTAYGFGPDRHGTTQFEVVATDAKGQQKRTYTDIRKMTSSVKEFNAGKEIWTSYRYDALNQVIGVTDDRGNSTTSVYDNFGRRTVVDSPDTGRTETRFDLAGNLVKKITANLAAKDNTAALVNSGGEKAIEYDYDFNRLTAIHYPVFEKNDVRYTYGKPGAKHNGASRVIEIQDAAGTVKREYGPLGEVTQETREVDAPVLGKQSYTTEYRYDAWNRVLQMTFPDSEELSYHYNSGGLVDGATGVKGKYTYQYLKRMEYDKFEQRVLQEVGNGTKTRYTYDAADRRLQNLEAELPKGYVFQNLDYTYDDVGNVTSLENDVARPEWPGFDPKLGGPAKQSFGYDDLNQLTSARGEFQFTKDKVNRYQLDLGYDSIHNLTVKNQKHEIAGAHFTDVQHETTYKNLYVYHSEGPHAPSKIGPDDMRYDDNGNLISREENKFLSERRQLIWDEENRLACAHEGFLDRTLPQEPKSCNEIGKDPEVRFTYDDTGTRVVKDGGLFNTSVYPNQNFSRRNLTSFKHVFIGESRLVTKIVKPEHFKEDEEFFYHSDHLGSTGFVTDEKGRLAEHLEYFPGGETWVNEHPASTPYKFSGKELDPETGLYYFGARYYDPKTNVWQSPDPQLSGYLDGAPNGGVYSPVNLAAYTYAGNNPLLLVDPTGAFSVKSFAWGAAKSAVVGVVSGVVVVGTLAAVATVAPVAATVAGVGLAGYGIYSAGVSAYEVYQGKELSTGRTLSDDERSEMAGDLVGGTVGAGRVAKAAGRAMEFVGARIGRAAEAPPVGNPCNSFTPETAVRLADGTAKPISKVGIGDEVLATDPVSGKTEAKPVTNVIIGYGEKNLVEVTVDVDGDQGDQVATVVATDEHPFWVENEKRWVDAKDLEPAYRFETADHRPATVTGIRTWTQVQLVYNLTVGDIHTYYVTAAGPAASADVLVHNAGPCKLTPYEDGKGHHVPAKSSYRGHSNQNDAEQLSISIAELAAKGIDHPTVTGAQKSLYIKWAADNPGKKLTHADQQVIETEALMRGMKNPDFGVASATVAAGIASQVARGVQGPTRIPWVDPP